MLDFFLRRASPGYIALSLLGVYCLFYCFCRARISYNVKSLGGRALRVRTRAPWGVDFLYKTLASAPYDNLKFWDWMFEHTGGAARNNYTVEATVAQSTRVILTADPENIKALLTAQFSDYGKGQHFHDEWEEFLGDSIFTTDGQKWHDSRQLIRPMFIRERVGDLEIFERHVQQLITHLGPGDGRRISIDELLFRLTLDAATDFLFGQSVGSLDNATSEFAAAFDEVQRKQIMISRAGLLEFFVPRKSFRESLRVMEVFIEPFINLALALTPAELEQKLSKSDTFIHALARFTRDRKVIRDQLVAVLLAGRDSTASTLSWIFLELARNPRVVDVLREMKYLTSIINETLRLYPVLPFNVRSSLVDATLPRGGGPDGLDPVGVEANTSIAYSTLFMQRRRDLYPPVTDSFPYDPLEWFPERWATWTPKSWQFIPFNGGLRVCIGQQFALVEIGYTICRIMQSFESISDYGNELVLKTDIILRPGKAVMVGFHKEQD